MIERTLNLTNKSLTCKKLTHPKFTYKTKVIPSIDGDIPQFSNL